MIVFDEIQSVKRGLLALKYFYEDAPQYHVIAAGSLLGISIHKDDSFPVGKVDFLDLYPLSYQEFILAMDKATLLDALKSRDWTLINAFKGQYIDLLRQYYYIGGMPEVVDAFIRDGAIKNGGRAKEFELAIMWLQDAGLIYKVNRVSNASLPLGGFEDNSAFKLFMVDVGLFGAKSGLENLKAKSLQSFREKYRPKVSIRTSMSNYREEQTLTNIPLYAIGMINDLALKV